VDPIETGVLWNCRETPWTGPSRNPSVAAQVAKKRLGGSKPGERRGGHSAGTSNKTAAIISAAMNAVAANAAAHTPLEFVLGMMRDPSVDPALRFKAAQASAMYFHPKPTVVPTDPAEGAKYAAGRDRFSCFGGRAIPW
jgi:hypothetical protein